MGKAIEFFVNSWIFGDVKLEEIVERVSACGYHGIELVGEPKVYKPAVVNSLVKGKGLRVNSICGMHPGPGEGDLRALGHPDKKERSKAVDYVNSCVDLAREVGARSVLIVPSLVGQPQYFVSKEQDWKCAVESIGKAAPQAEAARVILTIEPINRYEVGLVHSVADALSMTNEIRSPWVRVMGDTFHMQIEEGDGIPNAIRRAGGYWFQHLHCADNTREPCGRGTLPWQEIIRALHDIKYEGGMSLEPLPKGASPYDARKGVIPRKILDEGLRFALTYLGEVQELVMRHSPASRA